MINIASRRITFVIKKREKKILKDVSGLLDESEIYNVEINNRRVV